MRRRRGFTLVETVLVLVVIGLTGAIALPKFSQAVASSNLGSAKNKLTTLYGSARAAAASSGRSAYLHLKGNQVYATASPRLVTKAGSNRDTLTTIENVYTQYGIALASTRDSILIDPAGMGRDSAVIVLTKGSHTTTVRISQFGRIVK